MTFQRIRNLCSMLPLLLVLFITISIDPMAGVAEQACSAGITYVKQHVHHSAATIKAWTDWGKKHPKYHPPVPKLSRAEMIRRFNRVCSPINTLATESSQMIVSDDEALPEASFAEMPVTFVEDAEVAGIAVKSDAISDGTDTDTSGASTHFPVFGGGGGVPPPSPPPSTPLQPTPEPSSILLLGTGLSFVVKLVHARSK